jgi:rSAM/selenodomain-associated transferase 2
VIFATNHRFGAFTRQLAMKISIVIPTLNEAANLPQTLAAIGPPNPDREIIIADGGSTDATREIAQTAGAIVLPSPPGRATQQNYGAAQATGEIYLFLHADTRLPPDWAECVTQTLANPRTIAGAFELAIDAPQWGLRLVEWGVKVRSRHLQLPYGDQAIFLRATTFHQLGGFPDLPIMEDFQLVKQLQPLGQITLVPAAVKTSSRRWDRRGLVQTTLLNQVMILGFYGGIAPDRLQRWYRGNPPGSIRQAKSEALH